MLLSLLMLSGVWNIFTNYAGTNCNHPDLMAQALSGKVKFTPEQAEIDSKYCHTNFFH